jgi:hypothetical protein
MGRMIEYLDKYIDEWIHERTKNKYK